jgi:hypothetical protein
MASNKAGGKKVLRQQISNLGRTHRGTYIADLNRKPLNNFLPVSLLSCVVFFCFFITGCVKGQKSSGHHSEKAPMMATDSLKKSIPKEEHEFIGEAHLTLLYHAPAVRGRMIWGGLVPYGEVWVTGAHSATSLEIDKDFTINKHVVPAGKYAIFTIPGKETWQVIINKKWDQHLADEYDQKDDLVRVEITPEITEQHQERLRYTIVPLNERKGSIIIRWEKMRISVPVEILP